MTLGEKLKDLRKSKGYSQEKTAELLNVSRQAVTKWENDTGIPDIDNLVSISRLFGVSLDDLMQNGQCSIDKIGGAYESITEYDIDNPKHFDIHLGGAKTFTVASHEDEKLKVMLVSDSIPSIKSDFKLKIDDNKNNIDLDISRKNDISESKARQSLNIFLWLPQKLTLSLETAINADIIELKDIGCDGIELDVKADKIVLDNVQSKVEINCNQDMTVVCSSLEKSVDINQLSSCSKLYIPRGTRFSAAAKGGKNVIAYERNGVKCEDFSVKDSEITIELNGRKSELTICETDG